MVTIRERGVDTAPDAGGFISRVSWGSIFLGVVVALGIMLLLSLLGIALGFTVIDPSQEADPLAGIPIGTAIYFTIAHIIALAAGGYTAARLASSTWSSASVLHGVGVWALVALLTLVATTTTIGAVLSGTASLVSGLTGGVAKAASAALPDDINMPDIDTLVPDDFVSQLPPEVQQSLQGQDLTVDDIRREGRAILQEAISQQERERARELITDTATSIARSPDQAEQEIEELYNQLVGENGLISEQDRQEALQAMEDRLGIEPEEAEAMFDQWQQGIEDAAASIRDSLGEMRQQAADVAQQATDALAAAAWWAFIISLLGLLAAVGGAIVGRPDRHRL